MRGAAGVVGLFAPRRCPQSVAIYRHHNDRRWLTIMDAVNLADRLSAAERWLYYTDTLDYQSDGLMQQTADRQDSRLCYRMKNTKKKKEKKKLIINLSNRREEILYG